MHCPFCRHPDSRVIDSRETDEGQAIRRRRSCPECGRRFTTVETAVLAVVKRSGVTEPFSREKVIRGVRRACQGRQVDEDALNLLAQQVEDAVRAAGSPEVPSHEVGLAILGPLRDLDEVAYLRFASVYRSFSSADDFEREIEALRAHRKVSAPKLTERIGCFFMAPRPASRSRGTGATAWHVGGSGRGQVPDDPALRVSRGSRVLSRGQAVSGLRAKDQGGCRRQATARRDRVSSGAATGPRRAGAGPPERHHRNRGGHAIR